MEESNRKRRGRTPRNWVDPDTNETVNGLYRRPGTDVWRVRATGQEFTEPDERKAIRRFRELTAKAVTRVKMPATRTFDSLNDMFEAISKGKAPAGFGAYTVTPDGKFAWVDSVDEEAYHRRLAEDLSTAAGRQNLARRTGVPWLAFGPELKATKSDTLEALGKLYFEKARLSPNELSRSKCFWGEFKRVAIHREISRIDQVDHGLADAYETYVAGKGLAPKSVLHRYRKIRGIIRFAIKRGRSLELCRRALDVLAQWEVASPHPLDPKPISPATFWAVYGKAVEAGDSTFAALLLAALNCCAYGGEVSRMLWDEIDDQGGYVSRRPKTGVSRVAVLWPETLLAIRALPRNRDTIFNTRVRSFTVHSVADAFERYRDLASQDKTLTFGTIRDAAYTAALGVSHAQAELLAGHRLPGTADNYLRRNPGLVAEACKAIATAFGVTEQVTRLKKAPS